LIKKSQGLKIALIAVVIMTLITMLEQIRTPSPQLIPVSEVIIIIAFLAYSLGEIFENNK